jgi:DNA-binding CsgD family transcriptional regulator
MSRHDAAPVALDDAREQFETLTPRERSVLQRVAEGYSVVEIARLLGCTPQTVNAYKTRVARKLDFTHRNDYVRFALQLGLIGNSSRQQGATTTGLRS